MHEMSSPGICLKHADCATFMYEAFVSFTSLVVSNKHNFAHRLIDDRVESSSAFQWQSQLRYSQDASSGEAQVRKLPKQHYRCEQCGRAVVSS